MAPSGRTHLLTFSASTRERLVADLCAAGGDLAQLAATCAGAAPAPHRVAIVATTSEEFEASRRRVLAHLEGPDAGRALGIGGTAFCGVAASRSRTACVFPGLGIKHTTLSRDLDLAFPVVDAWMDALGGRRLGASPRGGNARAAVSQTYAALGDVLLGDLAMWILLRDLGFQCDALVGHSFGENALLVASGMVDDFVDLMAVVSDVLASTAPDDSSRSEFTMLALSAASRPILDPRLTSSPPRAHLALDNCPQQLVVWAETKELAAIEREARARREVVFHLPTLDRPVHTPLFPAPLTAVRACYDRIPIRAPRVPVWSAATTERFPDDTAAIRDVLARQWVSTVRFREVIEHLSADGITTFVEVGPGDHLSGFTRDTLRGKGAVTIATNVERRDTLRQLNTAVAQLFVNGHDLDLRRLAAARVREPQAVPVPSPVSAPATPPAALTSLVAAEAAAVMGLASAADLDPETGFFDLGLESIGCLELIDRLSRALETDLPQTLVFDHPSIAQLAGALDGLRGGHAPTSAPAPSIRSAHREDVAVVGIGCRFPGGADSPDAFWQVLAEGRDAVGGVPADRWRPEWFDASDDPLVRRRASFGAFLDDIRGFDAGFFGISPREALTLDPQQRLLLEVAWEALEHAAIDPRSLAGSRTGVFVGISNADYASRLSLRERLAVGGYMGTGNMAATAAGRVSFVLGLNGPCLAIDTACSSSLAAIHLAVQSLRSGESDAALAGGVNLLISPETTILLSHAMALSPSGRCRTFDAAADGYVRGEGCGIVVLKRLADATAAGDTVLSIIRGSAMNHDGRTSGLTVPSGPAQQRVVRQALEDAASEPAQIGYIEAHGTGTSLGDPIEINALRHVFGEPRSGRGPLRLGSVKTSIGHLEAAAGVASLIKVVLQHSHRELTPTLHFDTPNPRADWRGFDAEVVTRHAAWTAPEDVVSGVSSFGISGTNVHMVVAGAPTVAPAVADGTGAWILPVSARSNAALRQRARQLVNHLTRTAAGGLADVARTLAAGRTHFAHRRAVVAANVGEAVSGLCAIADGEPARGATEPLAAAYERGDAIDWPARYRIGPRAPLPTYPFERDVYWIDGAEALARPASTEKSSAPSSESTIAARLRRAAADERPALAARYVRKIVGSILGLPPDRPLGDALPLCDAGLDSLMALQLAAALKQDLGVAVIASDIVDEATVTSLARTVVAEFDRAVTPLARPSRASSRAPLSHGQRALWFLWRLAPDSTAYNQSMPLRIADAHSASWREAATRLVLRHPMLRTRFIEERGEPSQQVSESPVVEWHETDARGWPASQLAEAMVRQHERPFDLSARPPIRFHWFDGAVGATLLITMHHIACDAWSLELLRRDLAVLAADVEAGRRPDAAPAGRTYHEFVRWQRAMLEGDAGDALWAFWRDVLAEPRARIDLPTDRPRPALQTYRGQSVTVAIPADLATALQDLAKARGVTPFVLMLTTFLTLLHRWTRERDLIIGTPTFGRSLPEFAGIVGYFVEPVVMRARVDEGATFAEFLADANRRSRAALGHADFPFPLLVERLRVDRDPSRNPIFDITFNFLSRRSAAARGVGLSLPDTVDLPQADGKFDLTLTIVEDDGGMRAALGFNTDLFDPSTIEGLGRAWTRLLEAIRVDPDQPIASIPLSADDPRPVLRGRQTDVAGLQPVHLQLAAQARRSPDVVAVVAENGQLTYAELMTAASALASLLRERGVRTDVSVGLCTPRTTDFVVGLVGILLAGGAFVPMDPAIPEPVRAGMMRRAGATVMVHVSGGAQTVTGVAGSPAAPVAPSLDHLAYIIFTSGSTGAPKGVAIEHRALANYVASIVEDLAIEPRGQHAMVSTIGADLGHTVLLPSLVTGGTLHLLSHRDTTERARFASYLRDHHIDYLKIVPSHLAALIDAGDPVLPRKALILGGESSGTAWASMLARASSCRVFNHYGPTETTVGVMTLALDSAHPLRTTTLPLNHVVDNVSVWLLDEARRPVPAGVPGEIYVSGVSLARGYINDQAFTDERFVRLPDGTRAYRTGDVARLTTGGDLLLLGRDDRQVKLRGYRIELAQVEHALTAHPDVRQAVVLPDRDGADATALVAWVVPAVSAASLDVPALHAWLAERLPQYMLPSTITSVPTVPLTGNGKLDVLSLRGTLPQARTNAGVTMARDLVELRLSRIWMDVLDVSRVAPSDDFFDLGGHSLRAVRMASLIHDEFGVELPLATLFTHRTLEQLATLLRTATTAESLSAIVPMQHGIAGRPAVVVFPGAGGSLLYFQDLITALGHGVAVWGARAIGMNGQEPMPRDIPTLAAIYANEICRQCRDGSPLVLIGHSFGALVAFDVAGRLRARGVHVAALVVLDNSAPGVDREEPGDLETRDWVRHIATRIERLYGVDLGLVTPALDRSGPADADWLIDVLLRGGVLPRDTRREAFHRYVDLYRANVRAAAIYHPDHTPIDVPIVVLKATDRDAALGSGHATADPSLEWARWSSAPVTVAEVPGTHITMLRTPAVQTLARQLRATIESPLTETR